MQGGSLVLFPLPFFPLGSFQKRGHSEKKIEKFWLRILGLFPVGAFNDGVNIVYTCFLPPFLPSKFGGGVFKILIGSIYSILKSIL